VAWSATVDKEGYKPSPTTLAPRAGGLAEGEPPCPINQPYRTFLSHDTRGGLACSEPDKAPQRTPGSADGTVNLIGSGRDKAHEGRSHEGLCPSGHAGDLGPGLKGLGPGGAVLGGRAVIAAEVEQVADLIVSGEEALRLSG
jgi:hypothetical protein